MFNAYQKDKRDTADGKFMIHEKFIIKHGLKISMEKEIPFHFYNE